MLLIYNYFNILITSEHFLQLGKNWNVLNQKNLIYPIVT